MALKYAIRGIYLRGFVRVVSRGGRKDAEKNMNTYISLTAMDLGGAMGAQICHPLGGSYRRVFIHGCFMCSTQISEYRVVCISGTQITMVIKTLDNLENLHKSYFQTQVAKSKD